MIVVETTSPELYAIGQRCFTVRLHEFQEVELMITQRRDCGRFDEPVQLAAADEPVNNTDLTTALIHLAARADTTVGSSL